MKLLDRVKNFFYDDEEDEEEIEKDVPIKYHKEKKEKTHEEVSEHELFKSERTFNFPMDIEDEIPIDDSKEKNENVDNNQFASRVKKLYDTTDINDNINKEVDNNRYSTFKSYTKVEDKKEEKKFKPTPVISPIYGVLDKNYKKEDVAIDATREFTISKKLDYDTVRKKAYGNIYGSNQESEETKGIFFNLDQEKNEELDDSNDVKIIYNDVTFDDGQADESTNVQEDQVNIETDEDENILSETKEQDLFNLIDNMYNSDEEEQEDEE